MTLKGSERELNSVFLIEVLHFALDYVQMMIFRVDLKPQLISEK